jgi:alpha-aminoadipic semialdehyde synthase
MTPLRLGIRHEDAEKRFEFRVPVVPEDVRRVLEEHLGELEIWIQPTSGSDNPFNRCYPDSEFERAGARLSDSLGACPLVLGIKEIGLGQLERGKVYTFFSHTFKAQSYNLPMLRRLLDLRCTLIDYEMIGKGISDKEFAELRDRAHARARGLPTAPASLLERTVYFGRFAGISGVIDSLWALGRRLALEGYPDNPFSSLKKSLDYRRDGEPFGTYTLAMEGIREADGRLRREGLPAGIGPLIIGILGKGNTAKGTLELLGQLPHQIVEDPMEIPSLAAAAPDAAHRIYVAALGRPHTQAEVFSALLPHLTMVVNCVTWSPGEPRIVTSASLREIYATSARPKLRVIGDISCDPGGAVEFCRETYPDAPVYTYDPRKDDPALRWELEAEREALFKDSCSLGIGLQGPVVMAVTNLPCEFPKDASIAFSEKLLPYLADLARTAAATASAESFEALPTIPAIRRAMIAFKGELTPDYSYLNGPLAGVVVPKRALVLGAGKVSPELLRHLDRRGYPLRILDQNPAAAAERARELTPDRVSAGRIEIDPAVPLPDSLYPELRRADLVVSLLPPSHHIMIARACLETGTSLLTASYTKEIRDLDDQARSAGITLLPEMGLDPGIDHVSAVRMVRQAQAQGETVVSFESYCGGLPAPQDSKNPLRYKFSWRPQGALSALLEDGRYLEGGSVVNLPPLAELAPLKMPLFAEPFEVFANRDSLPYVEHYGANGARTFLRATLRYPGWGAFWRALRQLGWLGAARDGSLPRTAREVATRLGLPESDKLVARVVWLVGDLEGSGSPVEAVADALASMPEMQYAEGERDMVVLHHRVETRTEEGERRRRTATLVLEGSPDRDGESAMSLTTGGMLAIGAQLMLEGKIRRAGVLAPYQDDLVELIAPELDAKGISFEQTEEILAGPRAR